MSVKIVTVKSVHGSLILGQPYTYVSILVVDEEGTFLPLVLRFGSEGAASMFQAQDLTDQQLELDIPDSSNKEGNYLVTSRIRLVTQTSKDGGDFSEPVRNVPFDDREVVEIRSALAEFASNIEAEYKPSPEKAATIRALLEGLADKAQKLTKSTWASVAFGVIVDISLELGLGGSPGQALASAFKNAVGSILKGRFGLGNGG